MSQATLAGFLLNRRRAYQTLMDQEIKRRDNFPPPTVEKFNGLTKIIHVYGCMIGTIDLLRKRI